jgi:hypothetical protein
MRPLLLKGIEMTEDQKLAVTAVAFVACLAVFTYTNVKIARSTKRLNNKTDMLLKLNNFNNPELIK